VVGTSAQKFAALQRGSIAHGCSSRTPSSDSGGEGDNVLYRFSDGRQPFPSFSTGLRDMGAKGDMAGGWRGVRRAHDGSSCSPIAPRQSRFLQNDTQALSRILLAPIYDLYIDKDAILSRDARS